MNKLLYCLSALIIVSSLACSDNAEYPAADNDIDAGRSFIDACLKGQFKKAEFYMLKDAENRKELERIKMSYDEKDREFRSNYRQANIFITNDETLSDSVHIIYYNNTYDKVPRKVKVIKTNDAWLVDTKYSNNGNL